MRHRWTFDLQFPPSEILPLAEAYRKYPDNENKDARAFEAGSRINAGDYSVENLNVIYEWKLESFRRFKPSLANNRSEELRDALRLASRAKTVRCAVAVLDGLDGVGIPVASAILTAIKPTEYTVLDVRACRSLGQKDPPNTPEFYEQYLDYCHQLKNAHNVDLRTLDRALFWFGGPPHQSRR